MTPDQQRWLRRARELAADVKKEFEVALEPDRNTVLALIVHVQTLLDTPSWHGETLDAFLKDMLPLADCCASVEARLPDARQINAGLAAQAIRLAGFVSRVSWQLLAPLVLRFKPGANTAPPPGLTKRLALSASVALHWLPKALRAAAEWELGQATQQSRMAGPQVAPPCGPRLLQIASDTVQTTSTVLGLICLDSRDLVALRTTLCSPATLARALGDLAAVYALFARFPATLTGEARAWFSLTLLASLMLGVQDDPALAEALEGDRDMRQQLAAALVPYAAHLLEAADLSSASWFEAWAPLAAALAAQMAWPRQGAVIDSQAAQRSATLAKGLLRLLRALPPPGKPPRAYSDPWRCISLTINTARAAAAAASSALAIADLGPRAVVQRDAALRAAQQRALSTLLALLPVTVDLLAAAAGQLAASDAGGTGGALDNDEPRSLALAAYGYALVPLADAFLSAGDMLVEEDVIPEELRLTLQPGELAAAAEAGLRLVAHVPALMQPFSEGSESLAAKMNNSGIYFGVRFSGSLVRVAQQEVSAAPEPGGVRPSLQAQLRFVHTACKFARAALAPGGAMGSRGSGDLELSADKVQRCVCRLLESSNYLLATHLHDSYIPEGRAPLTAEEKRALLGAALAQTAASSAVLGLLPECPAREAQRIKNLVQLCRLLVLPDLAGALLAQHAELAEQIVTGLAAAVEDAAEPQATEALETLDGYFQGMRDSIMANRRLGPMLLSGTAGEALEAAVQQGLQGSSIGAVLGWELLCHLLAMIAVAASACFDSSSQAAAVRLQLVLQGRAGVAELPQEGWEALQALRAAADEWLAQDAQQQWRQEQLLPCAEAAATRACSNLACTNLGGVGEAGLRSKRCSGCQCVRYCSTACQRADWAAGHKAMCKRLQAGK